VVRLFLIGSSRGEEKIMNTFRRNKLVTNQKKFYSQGVKTIAALSLLSLISCVDQLAKIGLADQKDDWYVDGVGRSANTSNPVFSPFIDKYITNYKLSNSITEETYISLNIPVNFGEIEGEVTVGLCLEYMNGSKEILIRESWWKRTNDTNRELIIAHEFGHCHLGREHDDAEIVVNDKAYKTSLMNSIVPNTLTFTLFHLEYKEELFTGDSSELEDSLIRRFGN